MSDISKLLLKPLERSFYLRDTVTVAKGLLGKGLYIRRHRERLLARITEVEAYLGADDPASHSYRGLTQRNWPMFEQGGTCYVYLTYGISYCINVVTNQNGIGEAVLLRAAEPLSGLASMCQRRKNKLKQTLLSGPGKLTQAFGIDLTYNGCTFDDPDFCVVDLNTALTPFDIGTSARIGISKGRELPLRFFIRGSVWLSRKG